MAWIKGTATNYQTLMDALFQAVTRLSVQAMAVNAGGTGYTVGDVLTITSGTNTIAAQARVLTAPGGVVGTIAIENAGVYTTAPTASGAATTGGTGTGCTLNLTTASNGWQNQRSTAIAGTAQSAVVAAGGTGYTVGDTLTVSGGTVVSAATFRVATAPGGVVGTVTLLAPGDYLATPGNPASTTGGTGTGCTLTVTYGTAGSGNERELIVKGVGTGGTDSIYCGTKSFFDASSGARNWSVRGFTGFTAANVWDSQPGASSEDLTTITNSIGNFVPLTNATITYWLSVKPRRVVGVFKIGTAYLSMHMGFLNPFATAGEFPYPLYVAGCTNQAQCLPGSSAITLSGLADPQRHFTNAGPGQFRYTDGSWNPVYNATGSTSPRTQGAACGVYPCASLAVALTGANAWPIGSFWANGGVIPQTTIPGTPSNRIMRSPAGGAGDLVVEFPATIIMATPTQSFIGEIDGVFWFHAQGGVVAEDTLTIGSQRYRVFPSGNRSDLWAFFAVKEE